MPGESISKKADRFLPTFPSFARTVTHSMIVGNSEVKGLKKPVRNGKAVRKVRISSAKADHSIPSYALARLPLNQEKHFDQKPRSRTIG